MYSYIFPNISINNNAADPAFPIREDQRMKRLYKAWPKWTFSNYEESVFAKPLGFPGINPSDKPNTLLEQMTVKIPTEDGLTCYINPKINILDLQKESTLPSIEVRLVSGIKLTIPMAVESPKKISISLSCKIDIGDYSTAFGSLAWKLFNRLPDKEDKEDNEKEIITNLDLSLLSYLAIMTNYHITHEVFSYLNADEYVKKFLSSEEFENLSPLITTLDIGKICLAVWGADQKKIEQDVPISN